ncbi:hypothetical protein HMPREF9225_0087 [Peptoniphilus duerdenii ATCC BAA-1640]|uniref:Uncharacterized protein n=1 Tax=Peptoniphilus duerdenii ATCC BAA-1640 TaxID=862517 RepID=E0NIU8_9FIRM|nr:hypothetical protein HMPREF9225_0087 [Peptoniphilus duerdenii ATCC BAA-1640]
MRKRSLDFARDDPVGFGVMVCNIGDILLGVVVWGGMKEGSHPERRWWNKAEPS